VGLLPWLVSAAPHAVVEIPDSRNQPTSEGTVWLVAEVTKKIPIKKKIHLAH